MQNPFIVSGPIPAEYFCDRIEVSKQLVELLTNGNNVLLISPRRMGKTGLIYHCFDFPEIKSNYSTIFVDIFQTTSLQEFTFLLGKAIFDSLMSAPKRKLRGFVETLKSLTGKFAFDPATGAPTFTIQLGDIADPAYTLDEIFRFINGFSKPCLLAIDEFQQISSYPEKNVEALLRTYVQRSENCRFIFAGSRQHLVSEMFLYPKRPFYNSASLLNLDPIKREVYTDFVTEMFRRFDKEIDRVAVTDIYDKFQGITFNLQSIFNLAFARTDEKGYCSRETLETSVDRIITSGSGVYRELLANLTIRQKELLVAIAKEEDATAITSSRFIKRHGLPSASSVQAAANKLLELAFIVKTEKGYSVSDKFLALWLLRTY